MNPNHQIRRRRVGLFRPRAVADVKSFFSRAITTFAPSFSNAAFNCSDTVRVNLYSGTLLATPTVPAAILGFISALPGATGR